MAARVVVFPDPVGPVTRTSPRCSSASCRTTGGNPSSSNEGLPIRTSRSTRLTDPRCRNTFTRKRATPFRLYARSASFRFWNSSHRSPGMSARANASVSSVVRTSSPSTRDSTPSTRRNGGDPTFRCRSEPFRSARVRSRPSKSRMDLLSSCRGTFDATVESPCTGTRASAGPAGQRAERRGLGEVNARFVASGPAGGPGSPGRTRGRRPGPTPGRRPATPAGRERPLDRRR